MKNMNKKIVAFVLIVNAFLIVTFSVALAAAPVISINLPAANRFFIENDTCNTSVNITGAVTSTVKVYYPETDSVHDAILNMNAGTNYQGAFNISSDERYEALYTGSGYIGFKRFKVTVSNSEGLGQAFRNYAVAYKPLLTSYTAMSNITRGDFVYPFTGVYNCHAYGVDVRNNWFNIGPNSPTKSEDFMLKRGSFINRAGTKYTSTCQENEFPNAVYFNGDHTAKVISWYSDGKPYVMQSKWGGWECIKTYGSSPYKSGYGSPVRWYRR